MGGRSVSLTWWRLAGGVGELAYRDRILGRTRPDVVQMSECVVGAAGAGREAFDRCLVTRLIVGRRHPRRIPASVGAEQLAFANSAQGAPRHEEEPAKCQLEGSANGPRHRDVAPARLPVCEDESNQRPSKEQGQRRQNHNIRKIDQGRDAGKQPANDREQKSYSQAMEPR